MDHPSSTPGSNPNNERTGFLQFWLFVPDEFAAKDTMVAWFNGGPGCSSLASGVMFENSPVTVPLNPAGWCCEEQDAPLQYNRYAWTNATVMLYVEQPIGVGFSQATNDTPPPFSEDDVAADFDAFLQYFYKVFDGYESDDDGGEYNAQLDLTKHKLYLVGESYAGIYIPSIARGIYLNNLAKLDDSQRFQTPLSGIAIGNGKIDAITQDPAVLDFSYWHGLIDKGTRDFLYAEWEHCMANLNKTKAEHKPFHSFGVRDDCGVFEAMMEAAGADAFDKFPDGPNIYEYSTWDAYEAADGDNGTVSQFYNNLKVQEALNVPEHRRTPNHKWLGCIPESDSRIRRLAATDDTYDFEAVIGTDNKASASSIDPHRRLSFMELDTPWSVVPYIAQLLDEAKIDVLIYSGDRDIICCTQGSEEALRKMDWSGTREVAPSNHQASPTRNAWTEAPRGLWIYDDYPAGYTKSYKNLNLLTVYNAGHMVPFNQPGPALDMLTRFLKGQDFYDRPLVSFAGSHLPKEVISTPTANDQQKDSSVANEPKQSEKATGTPKVMSVGTVVLMVVLVSSVAFVFGFWVARKTMTSPKPVERSVEVQPLKEVDTYGSI
jgi:carboxypeptidase C (cathepsin A)